MRNIDLKSVRPAGLQPAPPEAAENISGARTGKMPMFRRPAELHSAEFDTADKISAGRTGRRPMFQH